MRDALLPNASFVGFTGTPIELEDANTRGVFGDYISSLEALAGGSLQRREAIGATRTRCAVAWTGPSCRPRAGFPRFMPHNLTTLR